MRARSGRDEGAAVVLSQGVSANLPSKMELWKKKKDFRKCTKRRRCEKNTEKTSSFSLLPPLSVVVADEGHGDSFFSPEAPQSTQPPPPQWRRKWRTNSKDLFLPECGEKQPSARAFIFSCSFLFPLPWVCILYTWLRLCFPSSCSSLAFGEPDTNIKSLSLRVIGSTRMKSLHFYTPWLFLSLSLTLSFSLTTQ